MGPWRGQEKIWENENTIQPDETRWVYLHSSGDPRLPGVGVHSEEDLQLRFTSNGKRRKVRKMQLSQLGQMNTHLNFISRVSACLLQQACTSKGTGDAEKNKNYLMPETDTWFWVTRSPQDSALSLPLPGTFPVCLLLLLCWNTNNFRECASCLACSSHQAWLHDISLGWFPAVTNPHRKLTLFSPGPASSSRKNIFLFYLQRYCAPGHKSLRLLWVILLIFISSQSPSSVKPSLNNFFFSFFLHFYCWSLLTWIILLSLNCFLYNLAHSILPDLLMPQHYSLNT